MLRYENKPASENIRIYYIIIVINVLQVSVTFCGLLQGGVFRRMYYRDNQDT